MCPIVAAALRSPTPGSVGTMIVWSVRSAQRSTSTAVGSSMVVSAHRLVELDETGSRQRGAETHRRCHQALRNIRDLGTRPRLPYAGLRCRVRPDRCAVRIHQHLEEIDRAVVVDGRRRDPDAAHIVVVVERLLETPDLPAVALNLGVEVLGEGEIRRGVADAGLLPVAHRDDPAVEEHLLAEAVRSLAETE